MIDFLEDCIEKLRNEFVKPGAPLPIDKQDLVQRLVEKKRQAEMSRKPKKQAPLPPTFSNTSPNKESIQPTSAIIKNPDAGDAKSAPSNASYATAMTNLPVYEGDVPAIPQINADRRNSIIAEQRRTSLPRQTSSETVQRIHCDISERPKSTSQPNIRQSNAVNAASCEIDSVIIFYNNNYKVVLLAKKRNINLILFLAESSL